MRPSLYCSFQFSSRAKALAVFIFMFWMSALQAVPDPNEGRRKSATCVPCHGGEGVSPAPLWPNLAGQKAAYFEKQLKDFRQGARQDPIMSALTKMLSDKDIEDLAAYFSQLKSP